MVRLEAEQVAELERRKGLGGATPRPPLATLLPVTPVLLAGLVRALADDALWAWQVCVAGVARAGRIRSAVPDRCGGVGGGHGVENSLGMALKQIGPHLPSPGPDWPPSGPVPPVVQ